MTTQQKLDELKSSLDTAATRDQRAIFINVHALNGILTNRKMSVLAAFAQNAETNLFNLGNAEAHPFRVAIDSSVKEYLQLKSSVELLESQPEFITGKNIIEPILSEIAKLEAELAADVQAVSQAAARLAEAKAAAVEKALAAVEAEFTTPESPAVEPEKPFRGKVKIGA